MDDRNNHENGDRNNKPNGRAILICITIGLIAFLLYLWFSSSLDSMNKTEIQYNKFLDMIEKDEVESVLFKSDRIEITPKLRNSFYNSASIYYTGIVEDHDLEEVLYEKGIPFQAEIPQGSGVLGLIVSFLPFALLIFSMYFVFRMISRSGGGVMGVGKSNAKVYDMEKETGVTFKDVAGEEEAKESIKELVDFLHNPGKYQKIGAKLPKGALLVGPPGTGKTLLAKAVAGEAHVPFFSIAGSSFVEMFVGVGASRVRDLFKQAQAQAPCIIFIDEIDAIGKSRDSQYGGGNDEREQTLNQLLAEMDGFDTSKGIVILAATNRPDVLDKALLRPGRFDRRIIVDRPDLKGRVDILKVHAKNVLLDDSVDLEEIGLMTAGAVGSDLANMINEAAILAVKQGRTAVTQADLMESVEDVLAGKEKKNKILSDEEKKTVAYHEVGHALIAALQKDSDPVQKITIIPRTKGSLGYTLSAPEEEKNLDSYDELWAEIVMCYGGRAAEELIIGKITNGASSDIQHATSIAHNMVTLYGMSEKFGPVGLESVGNRYLDGRPVMNCGEGTVNEIDAEVSRMIKAAYEEAKKLISENLDIMHAAAAVLLEKESITGKRFMEIYHKCLEDREAGKSAGDEQAPAQNN